MMKTIYSFFTKENISFSIAVIGFILSLYNFFKSIWRNRSKIRFRCKSCHIGKTEQRNLVYFQFAFENCSQLPISISRIFLHINEDQCEFNWVPEFILKRERLRGDNVIEKKEYYSEQIPHTIDGLGIWGGFFCASLPYEINHSRFLQSRKKIVLYTNRGKKRLKLPITSKMIDFPISDL